MEFTIRLFRVMTLEDEAAWFFQDINLPFLPSEGMRLEHQGESFTLKDLAWRTADSVLLANVETQALDHTDSRWPDKVERLQKAGWQFDDARSQLGHHFKSILGD